MKARADIRWFGRVIVSFLMAVWAFYVGIGFAFSGKALSRLPARTAFLLAWHPASTHISSATAHKQPLSATEDDAPRKRTISKIPLEDFFPAVWCIIEEPLSVEETVYLEPVYLYFPTHILEIPAPPPWHTV